MKFSVLREFASRFETPTTPEQQANLLSFLQQEGFDTSSFYQELEMTSQYVDTHQDISYASQPLSLHSHAFWEILYCCSCEDMEYLVGTERYRLQPGDIIVVMPGVSHKPLFPEVMRTPYKRYVLWLSLEFIDLITKFIPEVSGMQLSQASLLRTTDTRWENIGQMFYAGIKEVERKKINYEAAVLGNTIMLLTHITRAFLAQGTDHFAAEKPELLDRTLAYIEAHLSEKITLEDTARHFFVSGSTIQQTFRQKMGVSFYRCVTQRRLIAAKSLIASGTSLENVARSVGFTDYSSFYRAFKKEYGISPRQFTQL